jgi:hypothetical protein
MDGQGRNMIGLNNIVPMMGKIANAESGGGGDTMTPLTLTALANNSKVTLNKVGSPRLTSRLNTLLVAHGLPTRLARKLRLLLLATT